MSKFEKGTTVKFNSSEKEFNGAVGVVQGESFGFVLVKPNKVITDASGEKFDMLYCFPAELEIV